MVDGCKCHRFLEKPSPQFSLSSPSPCTMPPSFSYGLITRQSFPFPLRKRWIGIDPPIPDMAILPIRRNRVPKPRQSLPLKPHIDPPFCTCDTFASSVLAFSRSCGGGRKATRKVALAEAGGETLLSKGHVGGAGDAALEGLWWRLVGCYWLCWVRRYGDGRTN